MSIVSHVYEPFSDPREDDSMKRIQNERGKQFLTPVLWPILVAGAAACDHADTPDEFALRDGDTVVFLGDSITAARTYGQIIKNYTLLRYRNDARQSTDVAICRRSDRRKAIAVPTATNLRSVPGVCSFRPTG